MIYSSGHTCYTAHVESCIFCRIINRTAPAAILAEDADTIVFLSLEGHPLVVPKPHVSDIYSLSDELGAALMRQTVRIARAVKAGLRADGVYITQANEIAAGQDVFHLHFHIYPRWLDDGYAPTSIDLPVNLTHDMVRARIVSALCAE